LAVAARDLRARLSDPEQLVGVLPNADTFGWIGADEPGAFSVWLRPAIALGEVPIRTVWRPTAGERIAYAVEGRTDEHWVGLELSVGIDEDEEGAVADWRVECRFTGTMRAVGQRVLGAVVAQQARAVLQAAARAAA
jgi:carbon monoxide dehydrogenase subunit G